MGQIDLSHGIGTSARHESFGTDGALHLFYGRY